MEIIRTYKEQDLSDLKKMFRQSGFQGENFPTALNHGTNGFVSIVQTDNDDQAKIVMLARLSAEITLFNDPTWRGPGARLDLGSRLYRLLEQSLILRGIHQAWVRVPPEIAVSFGRRVRAAGFEKEEWPVYVKELQNGT
jgi:hypothetical protein